LAEGRADKGMELRKDSLGSLKSMSQELDHTIEVA